jgi:hypothetical protein
MSNWLWRWVIERQRGERVYGERRRGRKRRALLMWLFYIASNGVVICQPLINIHHAGNFPVSNGGFQLRQCEILRIIYNLIHRSSENVGMSCLVRPPVMGLSVEAGRRNMTAPILI